MTTTTPPARLTTDLARFLRQVNTGHVTYDWASGVSTLTSPTGSAPVDVTHLADAADLEDLVDVPENGDRWRLTGKGILALVRQGARA